MSGTWPKELAFTSVLQRARALDSEALSLLYGRYLPGVYRFLLARVGDAHLAEDLTSETFMVMVESVERVRADDELGFAAWLLGIARNKAGEHFRRQASRRWEGEASPSWDEPSTYAEEGDPLGVVVARERWGEVVAAMRQLTEEQRTVILYRCVLGYETEDVSRMMGRQAGAIRALQFRALSSLARLLAAAGTNPSVPAMRATIGKPAPGRRAQRSDHAPRR